MCEAASSEQPIALICAATKTCPRCNALKQVEEFPKTKGKFRGYCNCGLGQFDDCVMLLQNAIVYLLQYVAE